jgi:hypothetical protein
MAMEKRSRERIIAALRPIYAVLSFLVVVVYQTLFWWYELWSQHRANASLLDDVQANLYFLFSEGHVVKERWTKIHPFDYACVRIDYGNICFWFTRGRNELNVSLSPRHLPNETYELNVVIAALDPTDVTEQKPIRYLSEVADLIKPRLNALNEAYSEQHYHEFKRKLASGKDSLRVLAKQAEWDLNRAIYLRRWM